ncbi:hypothetical protein DICA4_D18448 [Diutina catenulata]
MSPHSQQVMSSVLRVFQILVASACLGIGSWAISKEVSYDTNGWVVRISGISVIYAFVTLMLRSSRPSLVSASELFQVVFWTGHTIYRGIFARFGCYVYYSWADMHAFIKFQETHQDGDVFKEYYESPERVNSPAAQRLCDTNWALVALSAFAAFLFLVTYITHLVKVWAPTRRISGFKGTFSVHPQCRGQLSLNLKLSSKVSVGGEHKSLLAPKDKSHLTYAPNGLV